MGGRVQSLGSETEGLEFSDGSTSTLPSERAGALISISIVVVLCATAGLVTPRGSGFRLRNLGVGFGAQDSRFRVHGLVFRAWGLRLSVDTSEFRSEGLPKEIT